MGGGLSLSLSLSFWIAVVEEGEEKEDIQAGRSRYRIRSHQLGQRWGDQGYVSSESSVTTAAAECIPEEELEYLYVGGKVMAASVRPCKVRFARRSAVSWSQGRRCEKWNGSEGEERGWGKETL